MLSFGVYPTDFESDGEYVAWFQADGWTLKAKCEPRRSACELGEAEKEELFWCLRERDITEIVKASGAPGTLFLSAQITQMVDECPRGWSEENWLLDGRVEVRCRVL